jgi:prepilin-type N-terminal cleavage/methylation domain-containing protein
VRLRSMNKRCPSKGQRLRGGKIRQNPGFVLIEVLAAVVLLGVLLVPLSTAVQSAVGRAAAIREQASRLAAEQVQAGEREAWEWGPRVASGWWTAGPVLHLELAVPLGAGCFVGLWADGWFVGRVSPDGDGRVRVDPQAWSGLTGQELVVRVGRPGDPWGPPWRLLIPDMYCRYPSPDAQERIAAGPADADEIVVHGPALANSRLEVSGLPPWAICFASQIPLALSEGAPGRCELSLGGRTQSFTVDVGGGRDVFY